MSKPRLGKTDSAFACLDLLSVITILFLLFVVVLPTAAKNRAQTRTTVCFSNFRHLIFAWHLYAHEHDGRLVHNYHGGHHANGGNTNTPQWATGWLDWEVRSDNTNLFSLRNPAYARLSAYVFTGKNVYKCPAENFQSPRQRRLGIHRVRSVSMNATIGDGNSQTGPWSTLYRQATNQSDIYLPSPAETSVIFEEHPDSINDPSAYPPSSRTTWVDLPSNHHNGAGAFSFADGHVNLRYWRSAIRNTPVRYGLSGFPPVVRVGDPDITWMSYHSQRRTQATY